MRTEESLARPPEGAGRALPTVLAVVVTHNGRRWLRDSLVSLNTQTYKNLDILVVDDASPDSRHPPPLKRIAKRHLKRRRWGYLRTPRPLGFGGAINWALARARTDADFYLFIHDDAALTPASVERMVARLAADRSCAIVGPKIVSWDNPDLLEEVGMAVDRLGYPYKGLEDTEIDDGQYDDPAEVFFVTSTCMLIRSSVFRQLRGWDANMRAFSEDMDLCWRARVVGHTVRLEPGAKARHAIALATGQRRSKFLPQRYYIRRNRWRSVMKNVAGVRLIGVLPLLFLAMLLEMVGFIILRQPRDIWSLVRAFGWNLIRLPQTIAERTRVQLNRKVSDRNLRRLMIRQTSRMRSYMQNQAGRLEEAWGRRTELLAARSSQARALGRRMKGRPALIGVLAFVALALAFRHYIWGSAASVGELLPYPDRATALWRAFFSPWQAAGLGQPGAASPALLPLGVFPVITFGGSGTAQKLLLMVLGVVSFAGAYKLVSDVVGRWGRFAAGVAYVVGGLGYAGVRQGALAALAFGAAAPFALHSLLRLAGWVRPPGWLPGREVAKLAAAAGLSAAFVPGSLLLYLVTAVALAAGREFMSPGSRAIRSVIAVAIGLALSWALLLPWSSSWWQPGAPLDRLRNDATWRFFASQFDGHGMTSVVLGQTPDGPALFGLALPLLGIVAALVGEGQRRRVALGLWGVVATSGIVVAFISGGIIRPFVSSPTEAGVLASLAFAALAGIAVGAFRFDLPRRGFGLVQGAAVTGMAAAVLLVAVGLGPAIWRGEWWPGAGRENTDPRVVNEIRSLLGTQADTDGSKFRALWIGDRWIPGAASAARPLTDRLLTGPRGQALTDLFERAAAEGERDLDRIVASVESGSTDRGGRLLGAFNVRFVVLERGDSEEAWLQQRDLAAVTTSPDYVLLENTSQAAAPGVYDDIPSYVRSLSISDPTVNAGAPDPSPVMADQDSPSRYSVEDASGPGVAYLPEAFDPRWEGTIDGTSLERTDAGWANAFSIPSDERGELLMAYSRPGTHVVVLIVVGLAWVVVLGAASSTRRISRGPR